LYPVLLPLPLPGSTLTQQRPTAVAPGARGPNGGNVNRNLEEGRRQAAVAPSGTKKNGFSSTASLAGGFEVNNFGQHKRDRRSNLPARIPAQKGAESPTSPSPVCSWRICAFWYHEPLRNRPQLRFDPIWVGGWLTAEARPFRLTVPLLSTSSHAFLRAACATIRRLCDPRPVFKFAPSDLPDLDPAPSAQEYPALRRLSNEPSFFQTPLKSHRAPPIPFPRALVESVPFRSRQPPCPLRQRPRGAPVSLPASAAQGGGAARSPRASLGFARSSGRALSPDPLPPLAHARAQVAPSCRSISPPTGFMLQPRDGLSRRLEPADDGGEPSSSSPPSARPAFCSREPPPRLHRRCLTLAPSTRCTHRRGFRTSAASAEGRRNPAGYQRVAPIFSRTRRAGGVGASGRRLAIRGRRLAATPIRHGVRRMLCHSRRAHLLQFTSLLRCLSCGSERLQHR
jgi:hypothetical protein